MTTTTLTDKPIEDVVGTVFRHDGSVYVVQEAIHNRNGYYTLVVTRRGYKGKFIWIDVLVEDGKIIYVDL